MRTATTTPQAMIAGRPRPQTHGTLAAKPYTTAVASISARALTATKVEVTIEP
jgi:hypothetical protein